MSEAHETAAAMLPPLWLRRTAVVTQYAAYMLGGLFWMWAGAPGPAPLFALSLLSFIAALLAFSFLAGRYLFLGTANDCVLDERERETRNRATRFAYNVLSTGVSLLGLYFVIAVEAGWLLQVPFGPEAALFVAIGLCLLSSTLPGAFIAWTERTQEAGFGTPGQPQGFTRWQRRIIILASAGFVCGVAIGYFAA